MTGNSHFSAGRYIGSRYRPRRRDVSQEVEERGREVRKITAGQSLGQKNTVLAVWMAQSFLNPLACVAPTAYIVWQNIVNSYQIYRKK